jgi:hypothetical protein
MAKVPNQYLAITPKDSSPVTHSKTLNKKPKIANELMMYCPNFALQNRKTLPKTPVKHSAVETTAKDDR